GLATPSPTAPESIVSRIGWYQALPSTFWIPQPENMSAQRWIGVIAPLRSQPLGSPLGASVPVWTCAARRFGGDVAMSVARPKPASLVAVTPGGGWRFDGSRGQPLKTDTPFGSALVALDPTIAKSPACGAG